MSGLPVEMSELYIMAAGVPTVADWQYLYVRMGMPVESQSEKGENMLDRSEIARALAKAIAYKQCGKDKEAEEWATKLVKLLECANILKG
jgi:hypothetical protein